jgi:hypothetical protein
VTLANEHDVSTYGEHEREPLLCPETVSAILLLFTLLQTPEKPGRVTDPSDVKCTFMTPVGDV